MTSYLAGVTSFWLVYSEIGFVLAVLACCAMALGLMDLRAYLDSGREIPPALVMLWLFLIFGFFWPVPIAVWLKSLDDDDGPWKG